MGEAKLRASTTSRERESGMTIYPIIPLLGGHGGSLHSIEMRLREIKQFLPDAFEQSDESNNYRIDAALKILAELLKE